MCCLSALCALLTVSGLGELAEANARLEERRIAIEESGSIAEASLKLTKVFEEAQKAADLYVENVKRKERREN